MVLYSIVNDIESRVSNTIKVLNLESRLYIILIPFLDIIMHKRNIPKLSCVPFKLRVPKFYSSYRSQLSYTFSLYIIPGEIIPWDIGLDNFDSGMSTYNFGCCLCIKFCIVRADDALFSIHKIDDII